MLQEVGTICTQNGQENVYNMYTIKNEKICTRKCGMDGSMVQRPEKLLFPAILYLTKEWSHGFRGVQHARHGQVNVQ